MQAEYRFDLLLSFPSTCTLLQSNGWHSWLVLRRSRFNISASKPSILTEGFPNFLSLQADVEIVPVLSTAFPIYWSNPVTERAGEGVTLLACIGEILGSNLDRDTSYSVRSYRGFPQPLQENAGMVLRLCQYRFLPNPFQLMSFYHATVCILAAASVAK
jgi:hypothetical protein